MTVLKAYDEGVEAWQTIVVGKQGPAGATGDTGEQGPPGPAGVVAADLPVTYDAGTQTVGTDGSLLITVEHGSDDGAEACLCGDGVLEG
jgi:hypothetical protein